jgi:hypothetical protein
MAVTSYAEVLKAAQLLPLDDQVELAEAILSPSHQQQLQTLLEKNRSDTLSPDEETILDTLLAEADQVALLKARARYTLMARR